MAFKFTAKNEIKANKYCTLFYQDKEYTFEDFAICNNKKNLEVLLKECTINYKGKKFSYEEFIKQEREFADTLELPNWYGDQLIKIEHLIFISNRNYYAGLKQFESIGNVLNNARYELIKSNEKILSNMEVNWDCTYAAIYLIRSISLQSSILWYNSIEDYLLQAVWLCFELYKKNNRYHEGMDYSQILKLCSYKSIRDICSLYNNKEFNKLLKIINDNRRLLSELREWANQLKHRGNLDIEGLYVESPAEIRIIKRDSDKIFSTNDFRPYIIDLDETIQKLSSIHKIYINFCSQILDYIDFNSALPYSDGQGKLIIPSKKKYCKILI